MAKGLFGGDDNFIWIIITLLLLNDDIFGDDILEWLPWLVVIICCGDDDIFDDFEEWLPWLIVLFCCLNDC